MDSFTGFFNHNFEAMNPSILIRLSDLLEEKLINDKGNAFNEAHAIYTSFLELVPNEKSGAKLKPFLGKLSLDYYNVW